MLLVVHSFRGNEMAAASVWSITVRKLVVTVDVTIIAAMNDRPSILNTIKLYLLFSQINVKQ